MRTKNKKRVGKLWRTTVWFEFDSAHRLPSYNGPCRNLHGHRYKVGFVFTSFNLIQDGSEKGMTCDFSKIKQKIKEYINKYYDHKYLNEFIKYPTAEVIAERLHSEVKQMFSLEKDNIMLSSVIVQETPNTAIEFYG